MTLACLHSELEQPVDIDALFTDFHEAVSFLGPLRTEFPSSSLL